MIAASVALLLADVRKLISQNILTRDSLIRTGFGEAGKKKNKNYDGPLIITVPTLTTVHPHACKIDKREFLKKLGH